MISDYGGAVAKVLPGTFVPDMPDETPKVTPLPGIGGGVTGTPGTEGPAGGDAVTSFKDTLKSALQSVVDKVNTSDQNVRDLSMGKTNDLGKVITSVEEANLALQFTFAMRSKLLEAYQEISRMQA